MFGWFKKKEIEYPKSPCGHDKTHYDTMKNYGECYECVDQELDRKWKAAENRYKKEKFFKDVQSKLKEARKQK